MKQTHREQTSVQHWGEGAEKGNIGVRGEKVTMGLCEIMCETFENCEALQNLKNLSFSIKKKTNRKQTAVGHFDNFYNPVLRKPQISLSLPLSLGLRMGSCFPEFPVVPLCLSVLLPFQCLFILPNFLFLLFIFYPSPFGTSCATQRFCCSCSFCFAFTQGMSWVYSRCFMFLTSINFFMQGFFKKP